MKSIERIIKWFREHRIVMHVVLIVLSLVALAFVAYILLALGTRHYSERTVPDFVGIGIHEAEEVAERHGLKVVVNDSLHMPTCIGGIVLDQLPKGGAIVKPGRTIYVSINAFRQRMVKVPYVAGRSLRQAKNALDRAGLGIERLEYVRDMATNYVLAQYVGDEQILLTSNVQAEKGTGVVLKVGVVGGYGTTSVPSLTAMTLSEAKSALWEAGLNVGTIEYEQMVAMVDRSRAKVYWQSEQPTSIQRLGAEVSFRLSLEEETIANAVTAESALPLVDSLKLVDTLPEVELYPVDSVALFQQMQVETAYGELKTETKD